MMREGLSFQAGARAGRWILAIVLTAVAWLSVGSLSAFASGEAHPFVESFGSFSNPNGIAVDESTGDVYVVDIGTNTIYKFDAGGNPVEFSALHSNALTAQATPAKAFLFPSAPDNPAAIAVDNSKSASDPSAGDLYVMDAGHNVVDKFSAQGEYLGQIAGEELVGLGIDAAGQLRIKRGTERVFQYSNSSSNAFVRSIRLHLEGVSGQGEPLAGFTVSAAGDDYQLFMGCGCIDRFGARGEEFGQLDSGLEDGAEGVAVAADPLTGHLYVDDQSSIAEWDPGDMNGVLSPPGDVSGTTVSAGTLVSSFGSGSGLSASSGQGDIAVDGASGRIYVSNPADGKVYVFASATPGTSAAKAVEITRTSATIEGAVDPRGGAVSSCVFEYGEYTNGAYEHSVPCRQSVAQIGTGTSPIPVSADISELKAGVLYHFRLEASNVVGPDSSIGLFASASPPAGLKTFEVGFLNANGTPDTQAGSHPYEMVTNIQWNTKVIEREPTGDSRYVTQPVGALKDVITDLPPGLVGDPKATTKRCTLAELDHTGEAGIGELSTRGGGSELSALEACPAEAFVGWMEIESGGAEVKPKGFPKPELGYPGTIKVPVYSMVPPHGVAVQFGAHFYVPNSLINAGVLAGGDYPVQATVTNAPAAVPIIATRLVIYGVPGDSEPRTPLLTLPTGCTGPLKSTFAFDSYQEPGQWVTASTVTHDQAGHPLALNGCSKLKFPPTITVSPDTTDASTSSGLTVDVHVPQNAAFNPDGLAESSLRDTTVTLPEGVALNPAGSDGLEACSEGLVGFQGFSEFNSEFEPGVKTATFTPEMPEPTLPGTNFCPDGSKIGTLKIKTPLLEHELEGAVYLAAQNSNPFGSLVAMYIVAEEPVSGTVLKLTGEVKLSDTGQIVTTFENTPDLPFENLELHFFGGERAPLATPSRCGSYTTEAVFTPWDGNGPVHTGSTFEINHGPHGGPCPGAKLPFNPTFTGGSTNLQAGSFTPLTGTFSREDGEQQMARLRFKLPPGLSGVLTGVKLCDEVDANAGTCGPESLVGETTIGAGVGSDPITVTGGKVYLTGPYKGAPFGLSVVDRVKAGPFDLERDTANPNQDPPCDCIVVRAKIEIDPLTTALTITSNSESEGFAIPHMIDGIPVEIKKVNFETTRDDFQFNPTNCEKMSVVGSAESSEGESRPVEVPFQATNCGVLGFKPTFEVSTSGRTSRQNGASLHVKLAYPKTPFGSQANIASVKVDLPEQLPSRLTTLQKACLDSVFDANPAACPAVARVGFAKAITPILPVPLEGPAYFVSHGGAKFPELVVVLQGYGVTIDLHGETSIKNGITSSTFHTVPDQPVQTFELNLPEGPYSAVAAPGGLCNITKTVLVKKKVKVRSKNGESHTVTRKVKKTVGTGLVIPTTFTAQNGAAIHENTPLDVVGCGAKAKRAVKHAKKHKK